MGTKPKRHINDRLIGDLWRGTVWPCVAALVFLAITARIDWAAHQGAIALPDWLSAGGLSDARSVLGALLGAVSTVLALIFSVTLIVLSVAVGQFGPRMLGRFVRDRYAQVTLGLFLASFLHCLGALVITRHEGATQFVPSLTIMCAVLLVVVSFGALVLYSHRVAQSIQTGHVLARVVQDLGRAIHDQAKLWQAKPVVPTADGMAPPSAIATRCVEAGKPVTAQTGGYVTDIHRAALVAAATPKGAVVRVMFRPGQFVVTGDVLAYVWPTEMLTALRDDVVAGVEIGWHRNLEQDLEFGIAQMVEIALRALSPAVNDTFTGIACVDWLAEAVLGFARLPENDGVWRDQAEKIRLIEPPLRFARVVKCAFDQIRQAADGNVAVTIRLLQAFERMGRQLQGQERRAAVLAQVEAVREAVAHRSLARTDSGDVVTAFNRAKASLMQP